ncbi:MAG TPA: 6-pyruvoyl-tetrahydropterin synthase-related protein [Acidimicrobiales bacterium]|nr:6-pyruvoyl-tetrahydropterin synthase-related protein [Acidimicrobiales bacterium]
MSGAATVEPRDRLIPLGGPRVRHLVRERPLFVSERTRRVAEAAVFVAIAVLLLIFFRPGLLLSQTTTTGGDTGAHIYTPWYLRTHLLPRGLISGWSQGWYAGFPVLHFYFPFVVCLQALLSYMIPYEIAFKIGTVLGTFFFPLSVYIFFRLLRFRFPTPIVGAVLSLGFLFMDSFQIYGGNIPSTLAGEYSFSLSLGMLFVFLGLAYRVATGDEGRPLLAAGVLAVAALSHLVPVIMIVLSAPLVLYWAARTHGARGALVRLGSVFGVAFALTAFWSVPFLARLGYSADMHWFPLEGWGPLFPRDLWVYLAGTLLAVVVAALRRDRRILLFLVPAALGFVLYFAVAPGRLFDGRVWSGRFLPFWYLGAYLSTAYLVGTAMPTLARLAWRRRAGAAALAMVAAVGVATGGGILRDKGPSYIDNWIDHNYEGYEAKEAFPTFTALMDRIEGLPPGRVLWEPSPGLGKFGTPVALMTIPYWTGRPTMEGIYFESSVTTPFHFLTAAEIAERPSNPIPLLPYHGFDMERGLRHMQLLDVSYFVAFSQQARQAASQTPGLEPIEDVGELSLFEVASSGQVVVPRYEPVVLPEGDWTEANLAWFSTMSELEVPLVRDGPQEWARATSFHASLPRRPVEHGGRSVPVRIGDDEITFTTDAIGQPHWVKTSYFPNWRVDGALGPYLASPSMMMVVPTRSHVRLHYERTWTEWVGLGWTLAALAVLAVPRLRRWALGAIGA